MIRLLLRTATTIESKDEIVSYQRVCTPAFALDKCSLGRALPQFGLGAGRTFDVIRTVVTNAGLRGEHAPDTKDCGRGHGLELGMSAFTAFSRIDSWSQPFSGRDFNVGVPCDRYSSLS